MGKRRKGGQGARSAGPKTHRPEDSKLVINSYEDVADSEDEFHIARDRVLLEEGPARKRQRKLEENDEFLQSSEEEVLALPSKTSDSDEDEELYESRSDDARDGNGTASVHQEEVGSEKSSDPEGDIDKAGWGSSRKDYYDVDVIQTEADALEEEEEALRLQKKQLQKMTEADFGFDEADWLDSGKADADDEDDEDRIVEEVLPQVEITDDMPIEERNRILAARYPEFGPLAKELLALQGQYEQSRLDASEAQALLEAYESKNEFSNFKLGAVLRFTALSAYLSALSMYFAILTSGSLGSNGKIVPKTASEMRNHPIMLALVRSRTVWENIKNADLSLPEVLLRQEPQVDTLSKADETSQSLLLEANTEPKLEKKRKKKPRRSDAQIKAEEALAKVEAERAERLRKADAEFATISRKASRNLGAVSKPPSAAEAAQPAEDSDDTPVYNGTTSESITDQSRRKKSLQFYTSQLAQKAIKRSNAGRDAGGDTDIPYRERLKDRQARLNAQAEARGKKQVEALGDSSADDNDHDGANGTAGDDEDYYATIASRTAAKKNDRAARKEAAKEAERRGGRIIPVETLGDSGRREVSYQIEKNRALDSVRKKNDIPRVKKRKKYDSKVKKLRTIRPVYKTPSRAYEGETTGIKSGIVRSTKL